MNTSYLPYTQQVDICTARNSQGTKFIIHLKDPSRKNTEWAAAVQSEIQQDEHYCICKGLIVIKLSGSAPH